MLPLTRLVTAAVLVFLTGCGGWPIASGERMTPMASPGVAECNAFFARLDQAVERAGAGDGQAAAVAGFPYLRVDRFLAGFAGRELTGDEFQAWVARMQRLAEQGRTVELANLPREETRLLPEFPEERVMRCGELLRADDAGDGHRRSKLHLAARVPDEYQTWKRVLGLYWLTSWPVKWEVRRFYAELMESYRMPLEELPVKGRLVRYTPPPAPGVTDPDAVRAIIHRSSRNPLKIPEPQGGDRERLFTAFAPSWVVDTVSGADRIGAPAWRAGQERPYVDTERPVVYRHISHTRFEGDILLQLNYVVWFPARPATSEWDIQAGHVDGITWRVTLSPDGWPLAYDSIHNCGCFHLFYPTSRLVLLPYSDACREPAFVPQDAPELSSGGERVILRIASTTHDLSRVLAGPSDTRHGVAYRWADYDELRSLPWGMGQRRSMFRPDGIVPGTQRWERWLLWPMGIPGPGEMRQWGHHATALYGRRHFDDPDLMGTRFELRE